MKLCEKNDPWSRKLPDNKAGRWQQIIRALGAADLRRGFRDAERMFTKLVVNSGQPSHRFMIYVLPWDPPPPSLPREPQVLSLRFMEWFHTGWGFQPGVLNPHGSAAQTTMLSAFSCRSVSSARLQKHHRHCFRLFPLILSTAVFPASSFKSTCTFNVCFVSDKIMSHVAFMTIYILKRKPLGDTGFASLVWTQHTDMQAVFSTLCTSD